MDGELLCEVVQGIKARAGVKAFLVFLVAALYLSVVTGRVGANKLVPNANSAVASKSIDRSCLLPEKRLVNSAHCRSGYTLPGCTVWRTT